LYWHELCRNPTIETENTNSMKHLIFTIPLLLAMSTAIAQQNRDASESTLSVTGEANDEFLPDRVKVFFTLSSKYKLYNEALKGINAKADRMVEVLEKNGFKKEEVETQHFSIQENKKYEQGKTYSDGFRATQQLFVEMDANKDHIILLIQAAADSDSKPEVSFMFFFSPEKSKEIEKILMQRSVEDAKKRATWLCEAAQMNLGSILKMSYGSASNEPRPMENRTYMKAQSEVGSHDYGGFNFNKIKCSEQVHITWSIR
jgi:uncharacterized protein YggE